MIIISVHCGSIRQTATIVSLPVEHLRTGDRTNAVFRFLKSPEYLRVGMKLIFREGRTKAIGSVSKLIPFIPHQSTSTRTKTRPQHPKSTTDNSPAIEQVPPNDKNAS